MVRENKGNKTIKQDSLEKKKVYIAEEAT